MDEREVRRTEIATILSGCCAIALGIWSLLASLRVGFELGDFLDAGGDTSRIAVVFGVAVLLGYVARLALREATRRVARRVGARHLNAANIGGVATGLGLVAGVVAFVGGVQPAAAIAVAAVTVLFALVSLRASEDDATVRLVNTAEAGVLVGIFWVAISSNMSTLAAVTVVTSVVGWVLDQTVLRLRNGPHHPP